MAISQREVIGFGEQLKQLMEDNKAELAAKGLDVTAWIIDSETKRQTAVTEIGKQDDMQAALRVQTGIANEATDTLYDTSSTQLDAIIGVLGKKSALAKQAGKLRSTIVKQTKKKTSGENNS